MIISLLIFIGILLISGEVMADDFSKYVQRGNAAFEEGEYSQALDWYHQAEVERPETPGLEYNIGTTLYKEGKYEEALENLKNSLNTNDIVKEAQAQYNIGNSQFRMGDFQSAIMAYQRSLELNPDDLDAKYNLELARIRLKEQMQKHEQDPEQQQQQQEQQEQQQKPEEEEEKEDQQQEQPQPQPNEEDQNEDQQQQPQPQEVEENEMSKEDAERILNALKDDEKDIQKKINRNLPQGGYQGNDW